MKILAIETSCEQGSIALWLDGSVETRQLEGSGSAHSGALLPAIKRLLADAGLGVPSLDALAFGRGPGAFTGVRLACGVAQGLALGAGLPVAQIGSLEALAWTHREQAAEIYCAMDARMNEVYVACYATGEQGLRAAAEIVCVPPEAMPLPVMDALCVGNAARVYADRMPQALSPAHVRWIEAVPGAAAVAGLAALRSSEWMDPALVAPDYVRNRVALTVAERLAQGGRA